VAVHHEDALEAVRGEAVEHVADDGEVVLQPQRHRARYAMKDGVGP
jgi:hypothetical protein